MSYKGIIINVIKNKAVVATDDFQCFYIKRKPTLYVGKEIEFSEKEIVRKRPVMTTLVLSAACLFLLLFAASLSNLLGVFNTVPETKAFAYIGVDINPSLEIEIDEKGIVLRLIPINDDAKELVEDFKPGTESILEVLNSIIDKIKVNNEKNGIENEYILVSSTLNDKDNESDRSYREARKKLGDLMNSLEESIQDKANGKWNIYLVETDMNQRKEAQNLGISTGRYALYNKYENLRNKFSLETAKSIKVDEMVKDALKYAQENDNPAGDNAVPTNTPYKVVSKPDETATPLVESDSAKSDNSKETGEPKVSPGFDDKETVRNDSTKNDGENSEKNDKDNSTIDKTHIQSTPTLPRIVKTPEPTYTLAPTIAPTIASTKEPTKAPIIASTVAPTIPLPTITPASMFWRFESYNYRGQFIRHELFRARISKNINPVEDSYFKIVPGLADPNCISFESKNFPGYYLKHENFRVILKKEDGTATYKEDATFRKVPGLADDNYVSYQSYNYTNRYIRHRDYNLFIEEIKTALDKKDATYIEINAE